MNDPQRAWLRQELDYLLMARDALVYSYELCQKIGLKEAYTLDELDRFEALTSRFARLSDLLTQKVLRLIDEVELEAPGTVRDRINRAEKRGAVERAADVVSCRVLRNEIAHEYRSDAVRDIFERVLSLTPKLLVNVEATLRYGERYVHDEA
jgi:hypothetical protein